MTQCVYWSGLFLSRADIKFSPLQALGQFGLQAMKAALQSRHSDTSKKLRILTHCNTGSLATAEYGTALGVIRAAAEADQLEHAYCTETRPYNQGEIYCHMSLLGTYH